MIGEMVRTPHFAAEAISVSDPVMMWRMSANKPAVIRKPDSRAMQ